MVARPGIEPGTQGFSIQKTIVFLAPIKLWIFPVKPFCINVVRAIYLPLKITGVYLKSL